MLEELAKAYREAFEAEQQADAHYRALMTTCEAARSMCDKAYQRRTNAHVALIEFAKQPAPVPPGSAE